MTAATPETLRAQLAALAARLAGRPLVRYLLPAGRIEFTGAA